MNVQRTSPRRRQRLSSRDREAFAPLSPQAHLIVLCAFLLLVFLTGGSSRADAQSLLLLRPVSLLVLGYGLLSLAREHVRSHWPLVTIIGAAVVLTALHLVPLPPALWQALPGRETVLAIDRLLGLEGLWRPFSLDPQATRNALMAWATPCAVLVLAIQLDSRGRETVLTFTLGVGALTALWALLQIMGSPRGTLYLYNPTNYGQAVGLFANRNHQAVFLTSLIPLIYCWASLGHGSWKDLGSSRGKRSGIATGCALLFVPLILITGSRSGFLTLVLSIGATAAIAAWMPLRDGKRRSVRRSALLRHLPVAAGVVALTGIAFVTIGLGRDRAFERLIGADPLGDARADLLPIVWKIALENFPWGTGMGSFDDVFRMYEPDALLMPSYVNHAHNDLLEVLLTGGLAGVLLLAFAAGLFIRRAWLVVRSRGTEIREKLSSVTALTALAVLLVASLVDYPLRTPAMASYAVLLAIWALKPVGSTSA